MIFELTSIRRISKTILALNLSVFFCLSSIAVAKQIELTVRANPQKVNGSVWDGVGGGSAGGGKIKVGVPMSTPPDLVLCTVTESHTDCLTRTEVVKGRLFGRKKNKEYSYCHNSEDCVFNLDLKDDTVTGIVIFDMDSNLLRLKKSTHDFVDAFFLENGSVDKATIHRVDRSMRKFIDENSMAFTNGEIQRRKREFPTCSTLDRKTTSCSLRQSTIYWN